MEDINLVAKVIVGIFGSISLFIMGFKGMLNISSKADFYKLIGNIITVIIGITLTFYASEISNFLVPYITIIPEYLYMTSLILINLVLFNMFTLSKK